MLQASRLGNNFHQQASTELNMVNHNKNTQESMHIQSDLVMEGVRDKSWRVDAAPWCQHSRSWIRPGELGELEEASRRDRIQCRRSSRYARPRQEGAQHTSTKLKSSRDGGSTRLRASCRPSALDPWPGASAGSCFAEVLRFACCSSCTHSYAGRPLLEARP